MQLLINLYLATTITSLITFTANYIRLSRFLKKHEVQSSFSIESFTYLMICFVPFKNISYGLAYLNGALWTEEEYEKFYQDYL